MRSLEEILKLLEDCYFNLYLQTARSPASGLLERHLQQTLEQSLYGHIFAYLEVIDASEEDEEKLVASIMQKAYNRLPQTHKERVKLQDV